MGVGFVPGAVEKWAAGSNHECIITTGYDNSDNVNNIYLVQPLEVLQSKIPCTHFSDTQKTKINTCKTADRTSPT